MYEIEKGVPIPSARSFKYPLEEMGVGDSFAVVQKDEESGADFAGRVRNLKSAASKFGAASVPRRKYSVRMFGSGYRCWRVE